MLVWIFRIVVVLVIISGLGGSGYFWHIQNQLAAQCNGLQKNLKNSERNVVKLERKKRELQVRSDTMRRSNVNFEKKIADLELEIDRITEEMATVAAKKNALIAKVEHGNETIKACEAEIEKLRDETAALKQDAALEKKRLIATIKEWEAKSEQLTLEKEFVIDERDTLGMWLNKCRRDNGEFVEMTKGLMEQYRQKGMVKVLFEKEPVTGLKKVRLENMLQEYEDKIEQVEFAREGG